MNNEDRTVLKAWLFPPDLMHWSKEFANFIAEVVDGATASADDRVRSSAALFEHALEHHTSIIDLIDLKRYGSALALARPLFEACLRGYWVYKAAPDTVIVDLASSNDAEGFPRRLKDMLTQLKNAADVPMAFLTTTVNGVADALHDYTHGGQRQIARRIVDDTVGVGKPDERIPVLLILANTVAFHAASGICVLAKDNTRLHKLQSKVEPGSPYLHPDG